VSVRVGLALTAGSGFRVCFGFGFGWGFRGFWGDGWIFGIGYRWCEKGKCVLRGGFLKLE
ncbi:hypothetical protein, partial [Neisseria sicca]|uniref:hypothetical protein n=1 Tax=Neisseria sicca TaxID=490 RepID=UPI001C98FFB0